MFSKVSQARKPAVQAPDPTQLLLRDANWHARSIATTMVDWNGRDDIWVFGYGSLIWRPEFEYSESHIARIHGYHRALCMWSRINRGTPEQPGLVFSLDLGGSCAGKAFRIPANNVSQTMRALWLREMPSAAYKPRWLNCHTANGKVKGLVFTMDRGDPSYVPSLDLEQTVAIVQQGHGRYGPCTEYVLQTADALDAAGISDHKLNRIAMALRARQA